MLSAQHATNIPSKRAWAYIPRVAFFGVLVVLMIGLLTYLLTPTFESAAGSNIRGMYDQPDNTVEVATFGTSTLRRGFLPVRMLKEHGISAYNCCTDSQPVVASYYLLLDMLQTQKESLSVVILDITPLQNTNKAFATSKGAERVAACMRLSPVSIEYKWAMAQEYDNVRFVEYLIPILKYHSRWADEPEDKSLIAPYEYEKHFRGWPLLNTSFLTNISRGWGGKFNKENNATITTDINISLQEAESSWNEASVRYYDKIIDACKQRGIDVIFVKTPLSTWDDIQHDCAASFAESRGVPFIDMCLSEVWDTCGFSYDADFYDTRHPNILGSSKITDYLGSYLVEHYDLGSSNYSLSERDNLDISYYDEVLADTQLMLCTAFEDYLDLIDSDRYTAFLANQGEITSGMSEAARNKASSLGLTELAMLNANQPYAGLVDGGKCVLESAPHDAEAAVLRGTFNGHEILLAQEVFQNDNDSLDNSNDFFTVMATMGANGAKAQITIDQDESFKNQQGLNIVVYNKKTGLRVDSGTFAARTDLVRITSATKE